MNLFLDTEWADRHGRELVSLALVGEDSRLTFYAEREHLPPSPTAFVAAHVYPVLRRGVSVRTEADFSAALRQFLASIETPCVVYDNPIDIELLEHGDELQVPANGFPNVTPSLSWTIRANCSTSVALVHMKTHKFACDAYNATRLSVFASCVRKLTSQVLLLQEANLFTLDP